MTGRLDFGVAGLVTIGTGKVEYGQGVWTALAQIAAEELDVALDRVRVAPVSTATSPDEGVTSGSRSVEESGSALREACVRARSALLRAAAGRLGRAVAGLAVRDGEVVGADGGTGLTYWSLEWLAGDAEAGGGVGVGGGKPAGRWSVAGRSAPRLDIPDKVTGRPRFIHDLVLPGMLYGRVVRPPAPAAELEGAGDPDLPAGVVEVVTDGSFLGVVARTDAAARAAAGLLRRAARWKVRESLPDCDDLRGFLLGEPAETETIVSRRDPAAAGSAGSAGVAGSAGGAARSLTAEFSRPFIAHASMAPSCAIARVDGPRISVWSHSQGIFALRGALAAGLGADPGHVTVTYAEGAGVYGHNGADDAALDAVLLARAPACRGRPVRVQWSREDELAWAPFGSAMLARLSAGLGADGRIRSWRQEVWSNGFLGRPGIGGQPRLLALAHLAGGEPVPAALDGPPVPTIGSARNSAPGYDIPDLEVIRHRLLTSPLRTSSLRSLGGFLNVFAIESFMDELAAAAGADPVEFRLAHLSDPRGRRVIEQAAAMAGWPGRAPSSAAAGTGVAAGPGAAAGAGAAAGPDTGLGIGYARYKGTSGYCAAVAEVAAGSEVRARRLWLAVDVGRVINPDGVTNQVEGGAVQSASWTLRERVRFDRTRVTSVNWDSYPILRFGEVPDVAVRIVAAPGEPEAGSGEVAQGPVAGAIGNALAAAVGVRVRDLPLTRDQVIRAIDHP